MVSLKKVISGHSSIYGHHNGKGINKLPKIRTLSVHKQLQAAITVIKTITQYLSKKSLRIKRKVSSNKNCETNESFLLTKQRRTTTTATMSKPTNLFLLLNNMWSASTTSCLLESTVSEMFPVLLGS